MSLHRLPSTPAVLLSAVLLAINLMTWTAIATAGAPESFPLVVLAGSTVWLGYLALTTP